MSNYLDTYKTPAACYRKAPVRRETDMERFTRLWWDLRDSDTIAVIHEPHEGPIKRFDPCPRQYYTPKRGGKQCKKRRKR